MNIIYKSSDINNDSLLEILKLWNEEMGLVYPITLKAFKQNVINYSSKECLLAYCDNKLVGFIVLKSFSDEILPTYSGDLFISLFYVSRDYRKNGIGSKLIDFAKEKSNNRSLCIGKDIDNFFPGIPTDFDNLTDVWLEKRGFEGTRYTHDLISYNPITYPLINKKVKYEVCGESRKDDFLTFLQNNNWTRWVYEAKDYFFNKEQKEKDAFIIGTVDNKIISFVRVNSSKNDIVAYNVMWQERFTNLGGIGPLGVDKSYRHHELGRDLISVAIEELKKRGAKEFIIDWTGLMEFYRLFGFEVWKSYKYMKYKNNNENN